MRRTLIVFFTALGLVLASAPVAGAFTAVYRYKNRHGLRMTTGRVRYLSRKSLHRAYSVDRYGIELPCGHHGYNHGSCDFLLGESGTTWCGNTYVRAFRTTVKVVIKASTRGCGSF